MATSTDPDDLNGVQKATSMLITAAEKTSQIVETITEKFDSGEDITQMANILGDAVHSAKDSSKSAESAEKEYKTINAKLNSKLSTLEKAMTEREAQDSAIDKLTKAFNAFKIPQVPSAADNASAVKTALEIPTANTIAAAVKNELNIPTAATTANAVKDALEIPTAATTANAVKTALEIPTANTIATTVKNELNIPTAAANASAVKTALEIPTASTIATAVEDQLDIPSAADNAAAVELLFTSPNTKTQLALQNLVRDQIFNPRPLQILTDAITKSLVSSKEFQAVAGSVTDLAAGVDEGGSLLESIEQLGIMQDMKRQTDKLDNMETTLQDVTEMLWGSDENSLDRDGKPWARLPEILQRTRAISLKITNLIDSTTNWRMEVNKKSLQDLESLNQELSKLPELVAGKAKDQQLEALKKHIDTCENINSVVSNLPNKAAINDACQVVTKAIDSLESRDLQSIIAGLNAIEQQMAALPSHSRSAEADAALQQVKKVKEMVTALQTLPKTLQGLTLLQDIQNGWESMSTLVVQIEDKLGKPPGTKPLGDRLRDIRTEFNKQIQDLNGANGVAGTISHGLMKQMSGLKDMVTAERYQLRHPLPAKPSLAVALVKDFWSHSPVIGEKATIWGRPTAVAGMKQAVADGFARVSIGGESTSFDFAAIAQSLEIVFINCGLGPWGPEQVEAARKLPEYTTFVRKWAEFVAKDDEDEFQRIVSQAAIWDSTAPLLINQIIGLVGTAEMIINAKAKPEFRPIRITVGLCFPSRHYGGYKVSLMSHPSQDDATAKTHAAWLCNPKATVASLDASDEARVAAWGWNLGHWSAMGLVGPAEHLLQATPTSDPSTYQARMAYERYVAQVQLGIAGNSNLGDDQVRKILNNAWTRSRPNTPADRAQSSASYRHKPTHPDMEDIFAGGSGEGVGGDESRGGASRQTGHGGSDIDPASDRRSPADRLVAPIHPRRDHSSLIGATTSTTSLPQTYRGPRPSASSSNLTQLSRKSTRKILMAKAKAAVGISVKATTIITAQQYGRCVVIDVHQGHIPTWLSATLVHALNDTDLMVRNYEQNHDGPSECFETAHALRYPQPDQPTMDPSFVDMDGQCEAAASQAHHQCAIMVDQHTLLFKGPFSLIPDFDQLLLISSQPPSIPPAVRSNYHSDLAWWTAIHSGAVVIDIGPPTNDEDQLRNSHLFTTRSISFLTTQKQLRDRKDNFTIRSEKKDPDPKEARTFRCMRQEGQHKQAAEPDWDNAFEGCNSCKTMGRQCIVMVNETNLVVIKGNYEKEG